MGGGVRDGLMGYKSWTSWQCNPLRTPVINPPRELITSPKNIPDKFKSSSEKASKRSWLSLPSSSPWPWSSSRTARATPVASNSASGKVKALYSSTLMDILFALTFWSFYQLGTIGSRKVVPKVLLDPVLVRCKIWGQDFLRLSSTAAWQCCTQSWP